MGRGKTLGPIIRVLIPYFSLARALWIPRVITRDQETGFFDQVDGPEGFREYRMRFLMRRRAE